MSMSDGREILIIPEIVGLDARASIIRIPPDLDAPLTPRVRRIIDSRAFQRLTRIPQLGFVQLVYPGATHTRFEHSLGVYRLTLLLVKKLARDPRFAALVRAQDAETLILAALLHDVGHFPFCHLLEDLKLPGLISHEEAAEASVLGELSPLIRHDWGVDPLNVCDVLVKRAPLRRPGESNEEYDRRRRVFRLLSSILSGPIDVDKMDYLMRDSHAAGVPYGRNYDLDRLVGSICLNEQGDGVAITSKGKTAAELMVFARYVMFSEVYWHHASRAATVMFQRAVFSLSRALGSNRTLIDDLRTLSNAEVQSRLFELLNTWELTSQPALRKEIHTLLAGLFGSERRLYKRAREFSAMESPRLYAQIAGRSYNEVNQIADLVAYRLGLRPGDALIDAPPIDKEVEFKIDVFYQREGLYRALSDVSPVVRALALEQFDDYVKRVRLFIDPRAIDRVRELENIDQLLATVVNEYDHDSRF